MTVSLPQWHCRFAKCGCTLSEEQRTDPEVWFDRFLNGFHRVCVILTVFLCLSVCRVWFPRCFVPLWRLCFSPCAVLRQSVSCCTFLCRFVLLLIKKAVVVNFDHNILQRSSSQETEGSSIIFLPQWINPNSDEEQNVSVEDGYESVDWMLILCTIRQWTKQWKWH